jgi:hypothetical protein
MVSEMDLTRVRTVRTIRTMNNATATEMPLALTERNGFIVHGDLKIVRGGLGEFLICSDDVCIGVCRSYRSAMAFANGYAAGKAAVRP